MAHIQLISVILCALAIPAHATVGKVRVQGTRGGYVVMQHGPNLSTTPQPVTSAAVFTGTGSFGGGKRVKVSGVTQPGTADIGNIIDMPVANTGGQKAPVVVKTTGVPRAKLAKAIVEGAASGARGGAAGIVVGIGVTLVLNHIANKYNSLVPASDYVNVDSDKGIGRNAEGVCFYNGDRVCYGDVMAAVRAADGTSGVESCAPSPAMVGLYDCRDKDGVIRFTVYSERKVNWQPMPWINDGLADSVPDGVLEDGANEAGPNLPVEVGSPGEKTTATGPDKLPSTTRSGTDSNGNPTSTTTNTTINYNDNRVTITQNTTTTTTNPDGTTTTTEQVGNPDTSITAPAEQEPPPDPCEAHPERIGCSQYGEPGDGEIPKAQKQIKMEDGPSFSGGACPASVRVSLLGQQVELLNPAPICNLLVTFARPVVILAAMLLAFFMLVPRES